MSGRRLLAALGGWVLCAGALYGVLALFARVLARAFFRAHANDFSALLVLVAYLILFAALWLAFGGWRALRDQLGFHYTSWVHLVAAPGLWLLTVVVGALVSVPFMRWLGPPKGNAEALVRSVHDPFASAVLIGTVILVAPICEELVFRGGIFGWLRGRVNVGVAAAVSAALFSGAHLLPSGFVLLFVFGLSAALFYQWTGSTLNTFVLHACQNTAAVIAVYSGVAGR